jgi:hypothetical protein
MHRRVEKDHLRIEHEGPHDRHPLTLPTGKLGGVAIEDLAGHTGQICKFVHAGINLPSRRFAEIAGQEGHVLAGCEMRKEPAILEHVAHLPPHFRGVGRGQFDALETDATAVCRFQPHHDPQQGRLAAAARPDEHGSPAAFDDEIERFQNTGRLVRFRDVGEFDHGETIFRRVT